MQAGATWNESAAERDNATGRPVRRLTTTGDRNNTPKYHFGSAFTRDSSALILTLHRGGRSAVARAELATGKLTILASVEGYGNYTRATGDPWAPGPEGLGGFDLTRVALEPESGTVFAATPRRLLSIDAASGETRTVHEADPGWGYSAPGPAPGGGVVYMAVSPVHPELCSVDPAVAAGLQPRCSYRQAMLDAHGGIPTRILAIDGAGGGATVVHEEAIAGSDHALVSPTDPDLLLFDRNLPPTFGYYGDHCESPRAHLLRLSTGQITPLRPRNRHQFQSHTVWNANGTAIYYHGPAFEGHEQPVREGGRLGEMFLGVSNLEGESIFEMNFPAYYYGHVSTHPRSDAIITDGMATPDHVCAIFYRELGATGLPRIELLAHHGTDWSAVSGQASHPHCHVSPDGRWLSFNRAAGGRSDVYVVRLD